MAATEAIAGRPVLIADDFGLGRQHDEVILDLIDRGAVDATSVLVETCTATSADALRARGDRARIGLHFNLTLAPPGARPRPGRLAWLVRGALGLGTREAEAALDRQLGLFRELFGRAPDYIDGHEHCHAYPTVRDIVIRRAATEGLALRSLKPLEPPVGLKARVLARLGTVLARRAQRRGVRTNWRFAGVLPLDRPEAAIAELSRLLDRAEARAAAAPGEIWVMVHPGAPGDPVQIAGHSPALRGLEADLLRERHTGR